MDDSVAKQVMAVARNARPFRMKDKVIIPFYSDAFPAAMSEREETIKANFPWLTVNRIVGFIDISDGDKYVVINDGNYLIYNPNMH